MSNKGKDDKPDEKRAYRINEAVATYRLSRSTLYKLIAAGKLRSIKIGGRRLVPRDSLESLLTGGTT
jgi:excisionase family DNA binding protein